MSKNTDTDTDTKLNPATEQSTSSEPRLAKDENEEVTTNIIEDSTTEKKETQSALQMAGSMAQGAKDNVFSMFGGGAKKEKREEVDDKDEPSGSSKKKAVNDVWSSVA